MFTIGIRDGPSTIAIWKSVPATRYERVRLGSTLRLYPRPISRVNSKVVVSHVLHEYQARACDTMVPGVASTPPLLAVYQKQISPAGADGATHARWADLRLVVGGGATDNADRETDREAPWKRESALCERETPHCCPHHSYRYLNPAPFPS